jgi:geranylgeranyl pyrophosphate synthase
MSVQEVLGIFRQKTAPAFEVALRLGAALAEADDDVHRVLARYSDALGTAYQIRDDMEDLDSVASKPTLPLAEAYDRAHGDDNAFIERMWNSHDRTAEESARLRSVLESLGIENRCRQLLESYKEAAVRSLPELNNPSLKGLLRRVIAKIFRVEIQGWCSEFEARNAASSETRTEAVG